MRPQAHTAASLVLAAPGPQTLPEVALCLVCGHLPDFDRSVARRLGVTRRDHHRWVSHSFVGWFPLTVVALRAARGGRRAGRARRAAVSLWLHLALDTYADGIAWLWPLYKDKIGLFRKPPEIVDRGWQTPAPLSTELGRVELAMWLLAALRATQRRRRGLAR
jgi:membrane-bound metal-dependent hydrolase YbcI (DUF457 family)